MFEELFEAYENAVYAVAEWDAIAPVGLNKAQREKEQKLQKTLDDARDRLLAAIHEGTK